MAEEIPVKRRRSPEPKRRPIWVKWLIVLAVVAVTVAVGSLFGVRWYKEVKNRRLLSSAREYQEAGKYNEAALTLQRVLQQNQRDFEATLQMAKLTDEVRVRPGIYWWRQVVDMRPDNLEYRKKLGEIALQFGDLSTAREGLESMPAGVKKDAAYHALLGRVTAAEGKQTEAEKHFREAISSDATNQEYKFLLAELQIRSGDPAIRESATASLNELHQIDELRIRALRALLQGAVLGKDGDASLRLARELRDDPKATFQDRLQHLALLKQMKHPDYPGALTALQEEAAASPVLVNELAAWLNINGAALVALEWMKRLPGEITTTMPVPVAMGQSYAALGDWPGIKPLVADAGEPEGAPGSVEQSTSHASIDEKKEPWAEYGFMRLVLLARSLDAAGQKEQALSRWNEAVAAAEARPAALQLLARAAADWKWDDQANEALWMIANGEEGAKPALMQLFARYLSSGSTLNMLQAANRLLQIDPKNAWARNNVAALSLLTATDIPGATKIAKDLVEEDPKNPGHLSTYAYALHLSGETEEAIRIMNTLGDAVLKDPGYAVYHGVMLAAIGKKEEARSFLEIAGAGSSLLPEERKLVADASVALDRK